MKKSTLNTGYFQCLLLTLAIFTTSTLSGQTCLGADPTASVFAIQPSCTADGSTINTDGYLQISEVTGGLSYQIAIDGGAFGPRADIGATFPDTILQNQSNPAGSRDYIVRIYEEDMNGASACFTDVPVTMQQQDCTVGCDCQEVIYLNEPSIRCRAEI